MPGKIYIDGQAGTTALRIREWLAPRSDLQVVTLPDESRRDPAARKRALEGADIVVLCLPDDAAREAASWLSDSPVRILDASTAHRVAEGWVYGLPELAPGQRELIAAAPRVANPGCYSSAVILLLRPLVDAGLIAPDTPLSIHALSGGFDDADDDEDAEPQAIEHYTAAVSERPAEITPLMQLGLIGRTPEADLVTARDAFARGDLVASAEASGGAAAAWVDAEASGQGRAFSIASIVVALLFFIALVIVAFRRGRRRRQRMQATRLRT